MMLELDLAVRFMRRRSGVLLRGTALAALAAISLATAALVITLALMAGYTRAIASALQQGNAHLVGFSPGRLELGEGLELAGRLKRIDGVRHAGPISYLTGLIEDPAQPANPLPVVLKAVATPSDFTGLDSWPAEDTLLPAVVGSGLSGLIGLETGGSATVLLPPDPGQLRLPSLRIRSCGTFTLSFSEFDRRWLVVPLDRMLDLVPETGVTGVEVTLDDPLAVDRLRPAIEQAAPGLMLTDWREMNRAMFAALRWHTLSLFVVLTLVVAVASFQITSALVVLAINKRRSAGILQALGATQANVRAVLMWAGTLLGGCGVAAGMIFGAMASLVLSHFRLVRFPTDLAQIYLVDHIDFILVPGHMTAIAVVCLSLVVSASLWPAWRASRLDPVRALKAV